MQLTGMVGIDQLGAPVLFLISASGAVRH
jgi:hypothetical protein